MLAPWFWLCAFGQADFEPLRFSVVRIESLTEPFSWLSPSQGGGAVGASLGTGWVVRQDPPLVVTNTHVIRDSGSVAMQLLVHSNRKWPARVVGVCPTFDLALLEFEAPEDLAAALADKGMALQALELHGGSVPMGLATVALGFPLGQQSLKISSGVIAGYEEVDGTTCIQSTAPISPGSSGGPLLSEGKLEVVGVNFAKAATSDAENVNFVIPAWRVKALLQSFDRRKAQGGNRTRALFRVPSADATAVHANDALRASHGCAEGVFLATLGPRSFLANADPPIRAGAFLQKVGGIVIDEFGTGHNPQFVAETVKYVDLFFMQPDLEGTVEVQTCAKGEQTTHNVSLAWRPAYDKGVQFVDEPHFQSNLTQVEVFGDVAIMELTFNHISELVKTRPVVARFLHPSMQADNRSALVVVHVAPGSYASEILAPGDIVESVNGKTVHSLADYRAAFLPDALRERVQPEVVSAAMAVQRPDQAPARQLVRRESFWQGSTTLSTTTLSSIAGYDAETLDEDAALAVLGLADVDDEDPGQKSPASVADGEDPGQRGEDGNGGEADSEDPGQLGEDGNGGEADGEDLGQLGEDGNGGEADGEDHSGSAASNGTIWELRTDDGKVYATSFAPALAKQLLAAEFSKASWQLSPAVLDAAEALGLLRKAPPFIASVLKARKASPTLAAVRSQLRREVGFLAPARAVDAAVLEDTLRPTIERSVPQI